MGAYAQIPNMTAKKEEKVNEMISDILLHSQISTLLSNHQRSFLLQQMGAKAEIYGETLC